MEEKDMMETYDDRRVNATLRVCTGGCGRSFYFVTSHQICADCWRRQYRARLNQPFPTEPIPVHQSPHNPAWHLPRFSYWDLVILIGCALLMGFTIGWILAGA